MIQRPPAGPYLTLAFAATAALYAVLAAAILALAGL